MGVDADDLLGFGPVDTRNFGTVAPAQSDDAADEDESRFLPVSEQIARKRSREGGGPAAASAVEAAPAEPPPRSKRLKAGDNPWVTYQDMERIWRLYMEELPKMWVQTLFGQLDTDHDGELTMKDFTPHLGAQRTGYALWEKLRREFEPSDLHRITPLEFIGKVKSLALGRPLSKQVFHKVPSTNVACLHLLNQSANAAVITLCKELHANVATAREEEAASVVLHSGTPHALWQAAAGASEWLEAVLYIEEEPKQKILDVYRALDTDADGLITPADFAAAESGVAKAQLAKWELLRREFDKDGSNSIDIDEFIDCFKALALRQPLSFASTFQVAQTHQECLRELNKAVNAAIVRNVAVLHEQIVAADA